MWGLLFLLFYFSTFLVFEWGVLNLVANMAVAGLRRARSAARARFPTAMITIALPLGLRQIVIVGGNSGSMEDLVRTVVEAAQKNELAAGSTYRANSL